MKKLTIIIGVTIAFIVSSCCKKDALTVDISTLDNSTYKCWYVTVSQSVSGNQSSSSWYEWNTERWLVLSLRKNKDVSGYSATYELATKYADEANCQLANKKDK